jgi:hypothetical protein
MTTRESHFFFTTTMLLAVASIWYLHGLAFEFAAVVVAGIHFFGGVTFLGRRRRGGRATWPIHLALSASLALVASVALFQWPLRVAYALSRPEMERVAAQLRAGRRFTKPVRVGAFLIERAEIREYEGDCCCRPSESCVCLWMHTGPAGDTGLVRCWVKAGPLDKAWLTPLDEQWQFVAKMQQPPERNARR